jgi:23S rRNA (guanine745-N1)-methyltransferase
MSSVAALAAKPRRRTITSLLACTVRDCGLQLERHDRAYVCPRRHSYDIARSGYINLLQPQDRRSLTAGDARAVVGARARLFAAGIGRSLVDAARQRFESQRRSRDAAVADLGSGSGDALAACLANSPATGVGIDLSVAAGRHAARHHPALTWVVANADRRLPLIDNRLSFLLSLHGRRNPAECARVLVPNGLLLVAVPAPDDLIELRSLVQGKGIERLRVEAMLKDHEGLFKPVERFSSREHHKLSRESLLDLLHCTYRGARTSASAHVAQLATMDVTIASDCVVFQRRT